MCFGGISGELSGCERVDVDSSRDTELDMLSVCPSQCISYPFTLLGPL